ncbi:hypothetical protein DQ04_00911070 [Trypanosoma grayi]|uniref:hypothetical protein n=1 Tax=Trypanosoma grayi TaxID=71804 RepID=UPI0004F41034|nr:hypothetical protein DQ04_00911070 [Trypanosoma grayi]KEG13595.1 hypothetical protein DQ04_00911070 [Trypanosoma grayi]
MVAIPKEENSVGVGGGSSRGSNNNNGGGPLHRFFFINNILCCSESADGSFRPSDVFVGLDPPPTTTLLLGNASSPSSDTTTEVGVEAVERDCLLFNTFGVLSGGVLVDPCTLRFVDFTDDMIITPTVCQERSGNDAHYESLAHDKIRAEGVLCLCSSIEPFNASGTRHTPLSWPRSLLPMNPTGVRNLARRTLRGVLRRLHPSAPLDYGKLSVLEHLRCQIKCTRPQTTFLTENIPFRFQLGGKRYRLEEEGNASSGDSSSGGIAATVGSPYSTFHAFTGLPKMIKAKVDYAAPFCPEFGVARRLELHVRRLVRPTRGELYIGEGPRRPSHTLGLRRLWWTFFRYFEILRVRPSSPSSSAERTVWRLEDDADVKYTTALQEFDAARIEGRAPRGNKRVASDAWDWLLRHDRERLLRRLQRVQRCLNKIDSARDSSL